MGEQTNISWTDSTFNPWWGCIRVSPGCENCYAEKFSERMGYKLWGPSQTTPRKLQSEHYWAQPVKWNAKAANAGVRHRVFCASMADVFEDHPDLPPVRQRLWELIAATPWLDWQLLTKRPENILRMLPPSYRLGLPENIWVGTSIENRAVMRTRLGYLGEVPAVVRFLSCEPLLEPLLGIDLRGIHWVIAGGESGGPDERRMVVPCRYGETRCGTEHWRGNLHAGYEPHTQAGGNGRRIPADCSVCGCPGYAPKPWAKAAILHLRDRCHFSGVPFWFKQWGGLRPTSGGHLVEGVEHHEMPREAVPA